jgi:tetratricopeptide (TPR) repeat protein
MNKPNSGVTEPTAGDTALERALHLAALGRVADALPLVTETLAAQPDSVYALQVLAYCHQRTARYADMLDAVERATALAPASAANHRQRARALVRLSRTREAVEAATEARRLDPHDVRGELVLADALLAAGGTRNIRAAAAATARARRLDPQDVDAHITDGHVQRRMAEFGRARAAYRRALAIEPENPSALYWLGSLDSDRGRALRAEPLLGDTLRAEPTDRAALHAATLGARRSIWLLTDFTCVLLLITVILVATWRDNVAGWAGVAGALATVALGAGAATAFLRWRLRLLSGPTRTLIRANLRRFSFALAPLRPVSMAVGGLLVSLSPDPHSGTGLAGAAVPLTLWPMLLLMLRARNWLANELYFAVRRTWFRVRSATAEPANG